MRRASQRGFTLVELLIVMFIIGVLSAVVIVNFRRGDQQQDLRQMATELNQTIRLAQAYTTGGNSISFCNADATTNRYAECDTDGYCTVTGTCEHTVPPGGYGIYSDDPYTYHLFANTDSDIGYYDSPEPIIYSKDMSDTGVGIVEYSDGTTSYAPATTPLYIVFTPPTGVIEFYAGTDAITEPELTLLVKNTHLDNVCRQISINRISNQISEIQTGCGGL